MSDRSHLVGRIAELSTIDRLLDDARAGRSSALLIRGDPGIGKTAFLRAAAELASDCTVLRASPREAEGDLSFAGVSDLVRPILSFAAGIPAPQRAALEGALAIGPPAGGDRFTVSAALLSLLAAAAEPRPVVALIDDAHWLDEASRDALLFVARRLQREAIVLLFALRTDQTSGFERAGIPELPLDGLTATDAAELMRLTSSHPVDAAVAEAVARDSGGNPLAVIEIVRQLTKSELAGIRPIDERPMPTTAADAIGRRLDGLPSHTRRALEVAAAGSSESFETIIAACEQLGIAADAFDGAVAAGIVDLAQDGVRFRHPLLLAAVRQRAAPSPLRAAHRAIADQLERRGSIEAVARHRWRAATGPDAVVADLLAEAAGRAAARQDHAAAAVAYQRSAQLTLTQEGRAQRLLEAARQSWLVGHGPDAIARVDEASGLTTDPGLRAALQQLRAQIAARTGDVNEAAGLLLAEANRIAEIDGGTAALLLVDACDVLSLAGRVPEALRTARLAWDLARDAGGMAVPFASLAMGATLILAGEPAAARPWLSGPRVEHGPAAPLVEQVLTFLLVWLEDYQRAGEYANRACADALVDASPTRLAPALFCRAEVRFRTGWWTAALADASQALELAEQTGQSANTSLMILARIEAARGDRAACLAHVERALGFVTRTRNESVACLALAARGLLWLGEGQLGPAIDDLSGVARRLEAMGVHNPAITQSTPDLIEAYVRSGRRVEAARELDRFQVDADRCDNAWAKAAVARCRGLLADDATYEAHFQEALAAPPTAVSPFERARTQLCLGERLRRDRRKSEARLELAAATETLDALGALAWAERARSELRALGIRARRAPSVTATLTPQELRVALAVAQGATNREASVALLVSPRTIDVHLGSVYRKLGLRSRTELAALLGAREPSRDTLPQPDMRPAMLPGGTADSE